MDLPVAWDALFQGGPLRVEVGFGTGEFLAAMAHSQSGDRFVGIEHYAKGYRKLLKVVGSEGLSNVMAMVGDAYVLMKLAFGDGSLSSVTCNFSDPWPKARHAKRRLYTEEFFGIVAQKLVEGGKLYIATDERPYATQASRALEKTCALVSVHPNAPWLSRSPYPVKTRYEKKWEREGRSLQYFVYERRGNCPT